MVSIIKPVTLFLGVWGLLHVLAWGAKPESLRCEPYWLGWHEIQNYKPIPRGGVSVPDRLSLSWRGLNPVLRKKVGNAMMQARLRGIEVRFISGFRPRAYNNTLRGAGMAFVNSASNSSHISGDAVDIEIVNKERLDEWLNILESNGLFVPLPFRDPNHIRASRNQYVSGHVSPEFQMALSYTMRTFRYSARRFRNQRLKLKIRKPSWDDLSFKVDSVNGKEDKYQANKQRSALQQEQRKRVERQKQRFEAERNRLARERNEKERREKLRRERLEKERFEFEKRQREEQQRKRREKVEKERIRRLEEERRKQAEILRLQQELRSIALAEMAAMREERRRARAADSMRRELQRRDYERWRKRERIRNEQIRQRKNDRQDTDDNATRIDIIINLS